MELLDKIKQVNKFLHENEPKSISYDSYEDRSGYSPQWVIDAMNNVLLGEWGFEEIETHTVNLEKGAMAVTKVQVWINGIEFKPTAWGQSRVTKGNIGDAKKGAQTDAIKKALSYFSIGNRAYHGLLDGKNNQL